MRHPWRCHVLTSVELRDPRARNGAEREGFEPSRPVRAYGISSAAPSTELGDRSALIVPTTRNRLARAARASPDLDCHARGRPCDRSALIVPTTRNRLARAARASPDLDCHARGRPCDRSALIAPTTRNRLDRSARVTPGPLC